MRNLIILFLTLSVLGSCEKWGDSKERNFETPVAGNGINYHEGKLWVTDLLGKQIYACNIESGKIEVQYDFRTINVNPDDLIFLEDGTIVWTSPTSGKVGTVSPEGEVKVIDKLGESVNPIALRPNTQDVYIGFENESGGILKFDPLTGNSTTIISDIPSVNGFSFAEDGYLYAPVFDFMKLGDPSPILRIDVDNKTYETLNISFPDEDVKMKFKNVTGVVADGKGALYILESLPLSVFSLNIKTLEARKLAPVKSAIGDNIALSDDGKKLYVTSFVSARIYEIDVATAEVRTIVVRN